MFYSVDLTIPANTPASAPTQLRVGLVPGTVQKVDVQFPLGCVGLVHSLCRRGAHQLWPSNPEADFASNGQVISWDESYDLDDAPFELTLVGWNLDDTYAHTVTWRFALRGLPAGPVAAKAAALYELILTEAAGGP